MRATITPPTPGTAASGPILGPPRSTRIRRAPLLKLVVRPWTGSFPAAAWDRTALRPVTHLAAASTGPSAKIVPLAAASTIRLGGRKLAEVVGGADKSPAAAAAPAALHFEI